MVEADAAIRIIQSLSVQRKAVSVRLRRRKSFVPPRQVWGMKIPRLVKISGGG